MEHIGMYEARTKFAELVRAVKNGGEEFLITSRGEPVAMITQADRKFSHSSGSDVLLRVRKRRRELAVKGAFLQEGESVNGFARGDLKW